MNEMISAKKNIRQAKQQSYNAEKWQHPYVAYTIRISGLVTNLNKSFINNIYISHLNCEDHANLEARERANGSEIYSYTSP